MKYKYFVSFVVVDKSLRQIFGNTRVMRTKPISSIDDIDVIENDIKRKTLSRNVVILNIQEFPI